MENVKKDVILYLNEIEHNFYVWMNAYLDFRGYSKCT